MRETDPRVIPAETWIVESDGSQRLDDTLAVEAPLEIQIDTGDGARPIAVTMRTPGEDVELALGYLFSEGLVTGRGDVGEIWAMHDRVRVHLPASRSAPALSRARRVVTTSACGVCGTVDLGALPPERSVVSRRPLDRSVLLALPARLMEAQGVFQRTGGLHAAARFDAAGTRLALREDVGRHNALDKLIGHALNEDALPLSGQVVVVSGRASYELVQKTAAAGAEALAAVSAPTSLAVSLARRVGLTLIGFLRDGRFNVYAGEERLGLDRERAGRRALRDQPPL